MIEIICHLTASFHLGNAVKYLWRYGQKSKDKSLQDLEKARWYVARHQEKYPAATFNRDAQVLVEIDKLILTHTGA